MDTAITAKRTAITLDDVRAALGENDPNAIGASGLRERLGRGSLETIQRHLKALREERNPASLSPDIAVPPADSGLLNVLWCAAWTAARSQTLARLDALSDQRDRAEAAARTLEADVIALAVAHDAAVGAAARQSEEFDTQKAKYLAEHESSKHEIERLAGELQLAKAELETIRRESEHARALAERDAMLKDKAHQSDREHLLNQLAELKSAIHTMQGGGAGFAQVKDRVVA